MHLLRFSIQSLIVFFFSISTALAQQSDQPDDIINAQERINFSGKLRMLSQRIPSAACHYAQGIDTSGAEELLVTATAEFDRILSALEFGDTGLNIRSAETHRRPLARIEALRTLWEPFKEKAVTIAEGTATETEIAFLMTENIAVLQAAQLLVEALVKQYSNPNAATAASLMLIDISGRQRMLTQKMSKESCMLMGSYAQDSTPTDLANTIRIFEASLEALRFGLREVGIRPPPNAEIASGLDGVQQDWQAVEPIMETILSGETPGDTVQFEKFHGLNVTMANMNTVVGMYTAAAR